MLSTALPVNSGPLPGAAAPGATQTDGHAEGDFAQALGEASAQQRDTTSGVAGETTANDVAGHPGHVHASLHAEVCQALQQAAHARATPDGRVAGDEQLVTLAGTGPRVGTPSDNAKPNRPASEDLPVAPSTMNDDGQQPEPQPTPTAADLAAWLAALPSPRAQAVAAPATGRAYGAAAAPRAEAGTRTGRATPLTVHSVPSPGVATARAQIPAVPSEPSTTSAPSPESLAGTPTPLALPAADTGDVPIGGPVRADARVPATLPAIPRAEITPSAASAEAGPPPLQALPIGVASALPVPTSANLTAQAEVQTDVGPEVGSKAFAPALGAQLSVLVRDGIEHAQLRLNPADLGPIEVRIRVDGSQAQVDFTAAHALTRQALQDAVPTLASALREGGLTLTGGGVFEQPRDSRGETPAQGGRFAPAGGEHTGDDPRPASNVLRRPQPRGVLDLYA